MHPERAAVTIAHQRRDVVQPTVERTHFPTADDHEVGELVIEACVHPDEVGDHDFGREFDAAGGSPKDVREARPERPELDSMRMASQFLERQPARTGPETVAVRTGPQHEVETAVWASLAPERDEDILRIHVGEHTLGLLDNVVDESREKNVVDDATIGVAEPGEHCCELQQDVVLGVAAGKRRHDGRGPPRVITTEELLVEHVIVVTFEG
jgi:hypothetical protein